MSEHSEQPARVLLVEDDHAIRDSLTETLRDHGLEVSCAGNGREALNLLRTAPLPAAIVLDLMMPVMNGWDFRREQLLDAALRDIPVVVITAAGFNLEAIRTALGDVEVVPKPIKQARLLAILERCVGGIG